MPDPKQIEVTLTLKDEATKKIQSFRSSIKEFNNTTKDAVAPVLQLRQAWMKAGLAVGFVVGVITAAAREIAKLREEQIKLDQTSIKLGISSEALSKKLYGFNIGTIQARIGTSTLMEAEDELHRLWIWITKELSENIGRARIAATANEIAKKNRSQSLWGNIADVATQANPLMMPFNMLTTSNNIKLYGDQAKAALLKETAEYKLKEAIKQGIVGETHEKIIQLTSSEFDYKKHQLAQHIAELKESQLEESDIYKYALAANNRLEQEKTLELRKQQALRYKAEGDTIKALITEQKVALEEYKRAWGSNGAAVEEFKAGQKAQLEAARKAWFGIKDQYQITQQAFNGYVSAMENTFSTFIDDGLHGSLKKGADYFKMFGDEVIKIIAKVTAQLIILNAYASLTGSKQRFGFGDILKSVLGIGGAIGGGMSGGYFSTPSSGGLSTGTYGLGNYALMMHNGGLIKAHSGINLASDEVPIIAQTGERILSRNQNREYEKNKQGNGPIIVIQAWDTQDIMRNRKTIEGIISNALKTNSSLRGDIKTYG
ncbi:MAG: hypothetical protein NTW64_01760 [Candidatus Omnitrophica bacterium]|nr:hypothetical protein [Candidatus Omnitrophota bacterium]